MMKKKFLQGLIKRHPDGFGFFIPEKADFPDVYVPRQSMNGVMTSDRVMIEVEQERGGERFRGEVIKIISRGVTRVVGKLTLTPAGPGVIRDDGKAWGHDLKINRENIGDAKDGDMVVCQVLSHPDEGKPFAGKIVEVIGSADDPLNDVRRVLANNNIPVEFTPETLKEVSKLDPHVPESDFKGRRDLRSLSLITIDGATAKDFDDAIYVEQSGRGFRLIVAIADVSHYVKPGTALDKDAYERGTSVYFPNYVVPMLPEVLSNELCSLKPSVPRLSLVADMQMDFEGALKSSEFYEAVIESKARVTYGEAQEVIDGHPSEKLTHVRDMILRAADLAKILMAKRFREGSLDLEISETQIVIDSAGLVVDMMKSERLFAHRLIEEMMLSANVAVAKFFGEREVPALYRVHEEPNPDAIAILEKYLAAFGGKSGFSAGKLQKKLTRALQEFEGKPQAEVLNILTLRSMAQAKYSKDNVGHFGLGFQDYTHFTSPIRRYPDLIVHRLLKNLVLKNSDYRLMAEDDLATAGTMLSATEQRSVKAERQFVSIKKARLMATHLGKEFDGMISSVTKFGVFVLLRAFDVDGLIRLENLSRGDMEFDEEQLRLYSPKTGIAFSIGDAVKIRVAKADPSLGQIDFELVEGGVKLDLGSNRKKSPKNDQKRGKTKEDSRDVRKSRVLQRRRKNKTR